MLFSRGLPFATIPLLLPNLPRSYLSTNLTNLTSSLCLCAPPTQEAEVEISQVAEAVAAGVEATAVMGKEAEVVAVAKATVMVAVVAAAAVMQ